MPLDPMRVIAIETTATVMERVIEVTPAEIAELCQVWLKHHRRPMNIEHVVRLRSIAEQAGNPDMLELCDAWLELETVVKCNPAYEAERAERKVRFMQRLKTEVESIRSKP